jgi:hypothetical protein
LHDAQDKERKALAAAEDSRQAIAKADAKEKQFQAKIDLLQEALRAELNSGKTESRRTQKGVRRLREVHRQTRVWLH